MEWPARSPDLNPIELFYDFIGGQLRSQGRQPQNLQELGERLNEISMNQRCRECIRGRADKAFYIYYFTGISLQLLLDNAQDNKRLKKEEKRQKNPKRKKRNYLNQKNLKITEKSTREHANRARKKMKSGKKFVELTSGVDNVLKKTQGDLDRIKSTSFFQRKLTDSQVKTAEESDTNHQQIQQKPIKDEKSREQTRAELGIVEVSESGSEEEDTDDNIFDTAYIDAIAAGEVKLAYIPESPTEKLEGDDPFDTSIAERAILGPEVRRKGKKLVPIGAAVEVLTGRVHLPTCATKPPISSRRQILKEKDLLLRSFDDNAHLKVTSNAHLLDDDPKALLADEPIDLIATVSQIVNTGNHHESTDNSKDLVREFEVISTASDDPEDIEFEALAAESLSKSATVLFSFPVKGAPRLIEDEIKWKAFEEKTASGLGDPFDTTFVQNVLPGETELKSIGTEILNDSTAYGYQIENNNQITDRISESELTLIKPIHRDLLGGSNTDLSIFSSQSSQISRDPFDASVVDIANQSNTYNTSLKELVEQVGVLSDDDFDPRAEEQKPKERSVSRPDVLNVSGNKTVSFDISCSEDPGLLGVSEGSKIIKPLTPFYVRKNSVPELSFDEEDISDPFDTSFALNIAPGKAELKVIETELFDPNIDRELSLVDNNFDPRNVKYAEIDKVVEIIKDITNIKLPTDQITQKQPNDLLTIVDDDIPVKVLTPGNESVSELLYCDPFDTSSIATNLLPGKTELKLLETELIQSDNARFEQKSIENFLESQDDLIFVNKPLSPCGEQSIAAQENFDPFDTTASNPFLLEDNITADDGSVYTDNPFLSSDQLVCSSATNPFAFDSSDSMSTADTLQFGATYNDKCVSSSGDNLFLTTGATLISTENSPSVVKADNLLGSDIVHPQKPIDLDLKHSHHDIGSGPPRPPPPRAPPSRETQDLLMSVMGAMDATSSSLLDKIPPTRTPSPISMRDLHSPSPTPETNVGDLLDVDQHMCDINQNPTVSEAPEHANPARPPPPARPPKPAPPQKPPPPEISRYNSSTDQQIKGKLDLSEEPDLFGIEASPQIPSTVSKADILNLYNVQPSKPKQVKTDLLCDSIETEVLPQSTTQESVTPETGDVTFEEELPPTITPAIQTADDAFKDQCISPERQNDIQMDTSDSQSKGSVSSVTFNPFAATEEIIQQLSPQKHNDVFEDNNYYAPKTNVMATNTFADGTNSIFQNTQEKQDIIFDISDNATPTNTTDDFDAFAEKFDSVKCDENKNGSFQITGGAWGNETGQNSEAVAGFGADDTFDAFLAMEEPPSVPQSTPNRISKMGSQESDEEKDFSVFIRPKCNDDFGTGALPIIAPPPAPVSAAFTDTSPRFNPFDQQNDISTTGDTLKHDIPGGEVQRSDSQETPPTPLYDEDVSQPLEPFPRTNWTGEGWEMHLRQPNKKKITGQRFWKKIFVKLLYQQDCVLLQLFNQKDDKDPFQELPLQPCYSVSEIGAQQYDQFGKIFTLKLQYIFYKERPGVRPGQVKKAERITNKLSQFAAYAIQGDYQGVKEFGSDLKKLGLPVEHAPQVSQLMKLGSLNFEDLKQFSVCIEEALFRLSAHRDRALHYKMEEVQITAVDELYVEQDAEGHVEKQIARVRLFFLGFLTGMPDIELGVNDMRRQGKEVVGRHDIIPVVTEEWIRLEDVEFHSCVQQDDYNNTHIIKFKPPDACYIELMRFRVRPPRNRELPLQLKAQICITGYKVELRADVLVPGFASRKLGQIPCEDVMIRFPIPECWIYLFRVEKHFRYGSVKSAHRRTGKIKGIERILGTVEALQENLIEVTSGQAKYEHQHRAIVWRCPRLPKEGQGAYTTHNMVCRIALTNYDQMPDKLAEYCYVEFTMPATQASHTTCRSVSLQNSDSDEPPEKYVRYLARHEYRVGIEHTEGDNPNPYATATFINKTVPVAEEKPVPVPEESSSDSD
ncbi:hypothetical protein NQ317_019122 [Molorchus minor]|uniref:Protein stoned-B n=1 Tax=Molorchus minor TaxID=1323400 RepID=A0ABQ9J284_9CUCU|nr:hypothetical protein NQ317_019122 [Molorchus minor]